MKIAYFILCLDGLYFFSLASFHSVAGKISSIENRRYIQEIPCACLTK